MLWRLKIFQGIIIVNDVISTGESEREGEGEREREREREREKERSFYQGW
jgi:hypothetical protein